MKKEKVVLEDFRLRFEDQDNPFKVCKIINSTSLRVNDYLSKAEVDDLITTGWEVTLIRPK